MKILHVKSCSNFFWKSVACLASQNDSSSGGVNSNRLEVNILAAPVNAALIKTVEKRLFSRTRPHYPLCSFVTISRHGARDMEQENTTLQASLRDVTEAFLWARCPYEHTWRAGEECRRNGFGQFSGERKQWRPHFLRERGGERRHWYVTSVRICF